jgi:alpha-1,2-mannosyltransferase
VAPGRLRLTTTAAAVLLVAIAGAIVSWRYLFRSPIEPMVDLEVYQRAGEAVRNGRVLYEDDDRLLVFTYPPFAAVVAAVVVPLRGWWAQLLWTLASVAALVGLVVLSFRPLLDRSARAWRPLAVASVSAVAIVSHPFVEHVFFGQVNVFLALLCTADLLVQRRRWPQGVLIGVATALKLTPGIFVVYLWVTGRRRGALTAATTAVGCTALAALMVPAASVDYWTRELFEPERIAGSVTYTSNQSLHGLVARLTPGDLDTAVWLVVTIAVAWFGLARAREAHRAGDERGAVALVALLAILVSPIAWIHHYVWFLPVLGALVADGRDRRRVLAAIGVGVVLLLRLPWWGWALLDEGPAAGLVGVLFHNAYVLLAFGLLLALPVGSQGDEAAPVTSRHGVTRRNGTDRPLPAER